MAITKISTKDMTVDEWRKSRMMSIGGSDAAAIVGLSDYSSPYTVWAEKTGKIAVKEDNEAMRLGKDLEQYVSERFCEVTGKKVKRVNAIIKNDLYPFAHANIDRGVVGENAGLECKTTTILNMHKFANGGYPINYYVQCMHYMAVTNADKWYLAVLVLGCEFLTYEINRDNAEICALMQAENDFWKLVQNNTPPPADGSKSTTDTLNQMYAGVSDGMIELFDMDATLKSYLDAKERKKSIESEIAEYENKIKESLKDYEIGISGIARVTWKKKAKSSSRVFKVTKYKEE